MKRLVLGIVTVLLCGAAAAQGPKLTVVNNTGYDIRYLYISSNDSDSWEDDVLGQRQILENDDTFSVTLPENGTYDFKAVDADEDTYFKWNVMVRGDQTITFVPEDWEEEGGLDASEQPYTVGSAPAEDQTWVTVSNQTGYDIFYLYISPGEADSWGKDILGEETLPDGDEIRAILPSGPGVFDLKATDEDEDDYLKTDVTIDRGANRVVFRIADLDN